MNAAGRALAILIVAELFVAGWLVTGRLARPAPPAAIDGIDLSNVINVRDRDRDRLPALWDVVARTADAEDSVAAWLELTSFYLTIGYYPEAEACCRHAQELDPDSFDAVYTLGICLDLLGRVPEAIEQFTRANELTDPDKDHRCWFMLARNYLRLERPDEAIAALQHARTHPPAAYQLARLLVRLGRLDDATAPLNYLAQAHQGSLENLMLSAAMAEMMGEHDVAARFRAQGDAAGNEVGYNPPQQAVNQFRWDHPR